MPPPNCHFRAVAPAKPATECWLIYPGGTKKCGKIVNKIFNCAIVVSLILGAIDLMGFVHVPDLFFPFTFTGKGLIVLTLIAVAVYGTAVIITPLGWYWLYLVFKRIALKTQSNKEHMLRRSVGAGATVVVLSLFWVWGNTGLLWAHAPEIILLTNVVTGFAYIFYEHTYRETLRACNRAKSVQIRIAGDKLVVTFLEKVFAEPGIAIGRIVSTSDDSAEFEISFKKRLSWLKTNEIQLPIKYFLSNTHDYFEAPAVRIDDAILLIPFVRNVDYTLKGERELRVDYGNDYARARVEKQHISIWYRFKESTGIELSIIHTPSKKKQKIYEATAIPFVQYRPEFDEVHENKLLILPVDNAHEIPGLRFPSSTTQIEQAVADRVRNGILAMGSDFELELTLKLPIQRDVWDSARISIVSGEQ